MVGDVRDKKGKVGALRGLPEATMTIYAPWVSCWEKLLLKTPMGSAAIRMNRQFNQAASWLV